MRIYAASDEENLRTLRQLEDWTAKGFLTEPQLASMRVDIPCRLRCTNIYLRVAFFVFTLVSAAATVGLFFLIFSPTRPMTEGMLALIFAGFLYIVAEGAVLHESLYRYGLEEALAVAAVGLLCIGLGAILSATSPGLRSYSIVPFAGATASLLICRRFGFRYGFLAAMVFFAATPQYWTPSAMLRRILIATAYAIALLVIQHVRRAPQFGFLDNEYSFYEALLWFGLYAGLNLRLESLASFFNAGFAVKDRGVYPAAFYWATYLVIWCLPAAALWRAWGRKDVVVGRAGLIIAILTLATNKPYLGWERHTWDLMILGIVLTGAALAAKRWLSAGDDGVRLGFTAHSLSADDHRRRGLLTASAGILSSSGILNPPLPRTEFRFEGGDADGGGASSSF